MPGADECARCQTPLAHLDAPAPHSPVEEALLAQQVSALKPRPPVIVRGDATVGVAMRAMIDQSVGAVLIAGPVGELLGILTERDLLLKVAGEPDYEKLPVERFMTPAPETVSPSDILAFALGKMDARGYRHLPVVVDSKPVGMISVRDVLRHLTLIGSDS